ncbi:hypothetical protein [Pelagicoccus sp. SDUM812003]|uniref:hypothetical protein n=1 Tax=Pelagicoccus sp. SDUM812003 TaxID=3041267 RepID=UPI00280F94F2|nr:hypothetical protein [Pelagicoccus sp. SDUM812003]MDQ8204473.1 hypothetical protein [Pelagicoccus sp. SDUM812003]
MPRFAPTLWLFLFAGLAVPSSAGLLEVGRLQFDLTEEPRSGELWYEIAVTVEARRGEGDLLGKRFTDSVEVACSLAFEVEREGERGFAFYRAELEWVTIDEGRHVARFYLPPEVVERDRLRGAPHSFQIRLQAEGQDPVWFWSDSLEREASRERFLTLLEVEASRNAGILRSQRLTPFAWLYPESTPTERFTSIR